MPPFRATAQPIVFGRRRASTAEPRTTLGEKMRRLCGTNARPPDRIVGNLKLDLSRRCLGPVRGTDTEPASKSPPPTSASVSLSFMPNAFQVPSLLGSQLLHRKLQCDLEPRSAYSEGGAAEDPLAVSL